MTPEGKVKAKLKRRLDALGCYHFSPQSGIYGRAGIADIIGCYNGKFFAFECKAGGNTTTALQDKELQKVRNAGGTAMVIDESNVDEVDMILMLGGLK